MPAMRFVLKHAVATGVVVAGIAAFTTVSYFALLAWAVLAGEPLGGPLAFPFMVLFALVASVVSVGAVLLPATAVTEWICVRNKLRLVFQIPMATGLVGLLLLLGAAGISVLGGMPLGSAALAAGVVFVVLLVPLGAYWWSLQSADWLVRMATSWWTSPKGSGATPRVGGEAG